MRIADGYLCEVHIVASLLVHMDMCLGLFVKVIFCESVYLDHCDCKLVLHYALCNDATTNPTSFIY